MGRPTVALLLLAALCLVPGPARAQQDYPGVLFEYLSGDADAALRHLATLDRQEVEAGVEAFDTTRSLQILAAAAAMHTEAAIRAGLGGATNTYHLQVATAIVQFGEEPKRKSNSTLSIHPQHAAPVSANFRRQWYCAVITVLEATAKVSAADKYLDHALTLFPGDADVHLLAGIAAEMRASPRTTSYGGGERKALDNAERHFRAALSAAPDRREARLRLGRVQQQRNELADARALLAPLTTNAEDPRVAYLAALFLGGIENASRHTDAALALYDRAGAMMPTAQAARLAASELRHRAGDKLAAAAALPAAAGDGNSFDPWWTYIFGEYWRADLLLDALRKMRRP